MSMWKKKWFAFAIVFAFASLTREVSMLAIPVVFIYLVEQKDLSANWRKAVIAILPGLLLFFLVRIFIPISGGNTLLSAFLAHANKLLLPETVFRLLINPFLPICFIPIIFYKHTLKFFKDRKYTLVYLCLVFLSTLFGNNNERLMAPAFIVFYMLVGYLLHNLELKRSALLLIVGISFLSCLHHTIARWPLPNAKWTYLLSFGATLVISIYLYLLNLKHNNYPKTAS